MGQNSPNYNHIKGNNQTVRYSTTTYKLAYLYERKTTQQKEWSKTEENTSDCRPKNGLFRYAFIEASDGISGIIAGNFCPIWR